MDRRTLLAVVLAGLVLVVYQIVFAPRPQPAADLVGTEIGAEAPADGTPTVEEVGQQEPPETGVPTPGRDAPAGVTFLDPGDFAAPIRIETAHYDAVLEMRGARISKWELREYTDRQDLPAELVSSAADGLVQLQVLSDQGLVDLGQASFRAQESQGIAGRRIQLSAETTSGLRCDVYYEFSDQGYVADFDVVVDGAPNLRGDGEVRLVFPHPLPFLERSDKVDDASLAALASVGGALVKESVRRKKEGWSREESGAIDWVGIRSKYFMTALVPDGAVVGRVEMVKPPTQENVVASLVLPLAASGPTRYGFRLYAGPMELGRLTELGAGLDRALDLGWSWIRPFSRLLLQLMNFLHGFIPNYGVVILVLSVATKLVFYPLSKKSIESMKGLQALKPEMDRINEQFKDDPQRKQQAILDLYKKHKVNPAGGCLPLLVQMPVFVALYAVLTNAIELRKEPFFLWMSDLSAPDAIGSLFGFPIHILPVLMAVTMFIQQKMTPTDPRQAALLYLMPVMMLFFFYSLPSGLVLYWTVSNALQIGQQAMMNKETKVQKAAA